MEHRLSPRQKTFKGGLITFGRPPDVECIIRDLSVTGANLELNCDLNRIPNSFTLIIRPELFRRTCKVAWREEGTIGVQFI